MLSGEPFLTEICFLFLKNTPTPKWQSRAEWSPIKDWIHVRRLFYKIGINCEVPKNNASKWTPSQILGVPSVIRSGE